MLIILILAPIAIALWLNDQFVKLLRRYVVWWDRIEKDGCPKARVTREDIVDVVRTAIGVNYWPLQTSDADRFVKARDAIAEVVANRLIAQKKRSEQSGE